MKCVEKNCSIFTCERRHPRVCKHYRDLGYCKFTTYCKFEHRKQKHISENSEKIVELERKLNNIVMPNSENQQAKEDLAKHVDKKLETLDRQILHMRKSIEEKDKCIEELSNRLKVMEDKFAETQSLDSKFKAQETKLKTVCANVTKLEKIVKCKEGKFECKECDYKASSEQLLKNHMNKKHNVKKEESLYPRSCELCDKEIKCARDLKMHMREHTCKTIQFQCTLCNYGAYHEVEIDIHFGKEHGENYICGLCDYQLSDLQALETHLKTCEIFRCTKCGNVVKNLHDIKLHIQKEHEGEKYKRVVHTKLTRDSTEEIESKTHEIEDL